MRYPALALLVLTFLAVAFAGSVGAGPPPQAEPAPQVELVQANDVPTDTVEAKIWLPEIQKSWPVPVQPGSWSGDMRMGRDTLTFTVTTDRKVCGFRHETYPCSAGPIVYEGCTEIKPDGRVSLIGGGPMHRGQFVSPTEAEGTWRFLSPRCYQEGSWRASFVE